MAFKHMRNSGYSITYVKPLRLKPHGFFFGLEYLDFLITGYRSNIRKIEDFGLRRFQDD